MTFQKDQINAFLVQALIANQFPDWAHLSVNPVPQSGWHNCTFRIGNDFVARLPNTAYDVPQVHREQRWLPYLRPHLPLEIPQPIAFGQPGSGYPWVWSIYRWIEGDTAASAAPTNQLQFADDLAAFLKSLHKASAQGGPKPGPDNFYRGAGLNIYDEQTRAAIAILGDKIDGAVALSVWNSALATSWNELPVWVHGDVALGNLLLRDGRLAAAIDFGQVCIGDPACDLAIAWTFFDAKHRCRFRDQLLVDSATWQRGKVWALWKAVIVAARLVETNAAEGRVCWQTIHEILDDAISGET
jgi:aminoglycoside phosphotransferase (APT) family kinase protein